MKEEKSYTMMVQEGAREGRYTWQGNSSNSRYQQQLHVLSFATCVTHGGTVASNRNGSTQRT